MADRQRVDNVIQGLRALQEPSLSIIRLSEPISAVPSKSNRTSDASSSAFENASPASLEADLSHYKELFSKLRFSYLEQVTKEKFLRAIVGDPPQIVEPAENSALETQLAEVKAVLKAQKQHVADMVAELDRQGRELSRRYETVGLQTTLLRELPGQIEGLGAVMEGLRRPRASGANDNIDDDDDDERVEMNLPLPATKELVEERRARLEEVEAQLRALRQGVPRLTRALEQEERELVKLRGERDSVIREAREAFERKKLGGGADELEMRGRWLRGVEGGLRGMLGVEA